jgi:hypothetical protein
MCSLVPLHKLECLSTFTTKTTFDAKPMPKRKVASHISTGKTTKRHRHRKWSDTQKTNYLGEWAKQSIHACTRQTVPNHVGQKQTFPNLSNELRRGGGSQNFRNNVSQLRSSLAGPPHPSHWHMIPPFPKDENI